MNATKPHSQTQDTGIVLFDEDYRAHIATLNAKLERERHAVWDLREQVRRLQAQVRTK